MSPFDSFEALKGLITINVNLPGESDHHGRVVGAQSTLLGRVGPTSNADGTTPVLRLTKEAALVAALAQGKYAEAALRGNCYSAVTATTGVAPGTTISTTGSFTLANPAGSGKRLRVQKLAMGYVSGTYGAGSVLICLNTNPAAAAVTGTAIVPTNLDTGNSNVAAAKPFTTSTLPATMTPVGVFCNLDAFAGAGATAPTMQEKDVDGEYIIEPGCSLTLRGLAAAGTSPLVVFAATWEEQAIV